MLSDIAAQYARPLLGFAAVAAAFIAPPWVPLVLIILLSLRFRAWEVPLIGLLMDLLWLPQLSLQHPPLYTILSLVIVWALEPLRREFLV